MKTPDHRLAPENGMYRFAQHAFAFTVDDTDFRDMPGPTGMKIFADQVGHFLGAKGMQVEDSVDGCLYGMRIRLGGCHRFAPSARGI
jgi:hypothetical protein